MHLPLLVIKRIKFPFQNYFTKVNFSWLSSAPLRSCKLLNVIQIVLLSQPLEGKIIKVARPTIVIKRPVNKHWRLRTKICSVIWVTNNEI